MNVFLPAPPFCPGLIEGKVIEVEKLKGRPYRRPVSFQSFTS